MTNDERRMTIDERHDRAKQLFLRACQLPIDERAALLDRACADDLDLRAVVEELLAFHTASIPPALIDAPTPVLGPPDTVARLAPGTLVDGRYRVEAPLGAGGMGEVYLVRQLALDRLVAIKVLPPNPDPAAGKRFEREARAIARLRHPHIVTVHDLGKAPDVGAYLVMEYVEGRSLSELIYRESGPLPFDRARGYMRQILRAVHHLHTLGIIHRDIKPSNVLIRHDDAVKLADFGIAKFTWQQGQTKTQKGLGTPEYMSPEQARGTHIDHRSDIYSLGITFFEMLTARKPFARGEETPAAYVEVIQSILSKPLPDPRSFQPGIPAGAVRLLTRATAKDPSERFQSATEFLGALEMVEENDFSPAIGDLGLPATAAAEPAPVPPPRRSRPAVEEEESRGSRAGLWIALVLLLLAVGGYFGYQYYDRNIRLQTAGRIDSAAAMQVALMIASDYRAYSMDHNHEGLASLFAPTGNTYFSKRNWRRSQIANDAEQFFRNIEATTVYDIQTRKAWAVDDSTINADWLFTYERLKNTGEILRGQELDRVRIELINGEWLITRQTTTWVKRRNEPAPSDEPEVIDLPTDSTPADGGASDGDTPPLFPPPSEDTSAQQPPVRDPTPPVGDPRNPTDPVRTPSDVGTPPINPNGGAATPRRFPSGPVDRPGGQTPSGGR
jgi:predicted Ser/Thr protein kinase